MAGSMSNGVTSDSNNEMAGNHARSDPARPSSARSTLLCLQSAGSISRFKFHSKPRRVLRCGDRVSRQCDANSFAHICQGPRNGGVLRIQVYVVCAHVNACAPAPAVSVCSRKPLALSRLPQALEGTVPLCYSIGASIGATVSVLQHRRCRRDLFVHRPMLKCIPSKAKMCGTKF